MSFAVWDALERSEAEAEARSRAKAAPTKPHELPCELHVAVESPKTSTFFGARLWGHGANVACTALEYHIFGHLVQALETTSKPLNRRRSSRSTQNQAFGHPRAAEWEQVRSASLPHEAPGATNLRGLGHGGRAVASEGETGWLSGARMA